MGIKLRAQRVCIAMVLLPVAALASDDNQWYATANIGIGSLNRATLSYSDGTENSQADATYEASFSGGGTLGISAPA